MSEPTLSLATGESQTRNSEVCEKHTILFPISHTGGLFHPYRSICPFCRTERAERERDELTGLLGRISETVGWRGIGYGESLLVEAERKCADREAAEARVKVATEVIDGLVFQFAGWDDRVGGFDTSGGLSALEEAFSFLGWEEPHPAPQVRCDEPGCMKQATCGWPQDNGPYRRTCGNHMRACSPPWGGEK